MTSLISIGLPEAGMDYDDLILSLLADRLGFLLTHRRTSVRHILDLLDHGSGVARGPASAAFQHIAVATAAVEQEAAAVRRAAADAGADEGLPARLAEAAGETSNQALHAALTAMASVEDEASDAEGSAVVTKVVTTKHA